MAKPTKVTLKKREQNKILKALKTKKDPRAIARSLNLPHRQIMLFLEQQGLKVYCKNSYL